MPAPLLETTEFVKWRVNAEDLALLRAVHGEGHVNEAVRALLSAYCNRIRAKLGGGAGPLHYGQPPSSSSGS